MVRLKSSKFRKTWISEYDWSLYYSTVKKFHIRRLGFNTKNLFSVILEFSTLRGGGEIRRKIPKFRKIDIFKCNLTPNYFSVKKFHIRRLDLNTKKIISVILEFLILREKIAKFLKFQIFEFKEAVNYSMVKKFHMIRLDLNTKELFLSILKFPI